MDIALYATNYLRRFNNLSAQATLKLAVPVYNYQLLDIITCDFKELGMELFINNIFVIIGINYTKNEITVEELPQGNLKYYLLTYDTLYEHSVDAPDDEVITATLDTIGHSVDQDL